jgi:hypothetical protein
VIDGYWLPSNHADPRAIALYLRHYSARHYRDGRARRQFCPPGEKMVLLTVGCDALFVWHHPVMDRLSGQEGVSCTIFRNESPVLSSTLIREASNLAWQRWPGLRLFTYVADAKVRSVNPGACFKKAGWKRCGRNATGKLTILERLSEAPPVAAAEQAQPNERMQRLREEMP